MVSIFFSYPGKCNLGLGNSWILGDVQKYELATFKVRLLMSGFCTSCYTIKINVSSEVNMYMSIWSCTIHFFMEATWVRQYTWIFALNLLPFSEIKFSWKFLSFPTNRSGYSEVFLGKGVLKISSKFTGEYPCRSALRHGCSPVNLLHVFRTSFLKITSGWLLLNQRINENLVFRV